MKQPRVLSLFSIPYYEKILNIHLMGLRYTVFDEKNSIQGVNFTVTRNNQEKTGNIKGDDANKVSPLTYSRS